jgi:hypothetical protein
VSYKKVYIPSEVRESLKAEKTITAALAQLDSEVAAIVTLFYLIAPAYLRMLTKVSGDEKDIAELERMFGLEDPRRARLS